jgi:hypothetical protein
MRQNPQNYPPKPDKVAEIKQGWSYSKIMAAHGIIEAPVYNKSELNKLFDTATNKILTRK